MASDARSVVGLPNSTWSTAKVGWPSDRRLEWVGEGGRRRQEGRGGQPEE